MVQSVLQHFGAEGEIRTLARFLDDYSLSRGSNLKIMETKSVRIPIERRFYNINMVDFLKIILSF